MTRAIAIAFLLVAVLTPALADPLTQSRITPAALAARIAANPAADNPHIPQLRASGQPGLDALLSLYDKSPSAALVPAINAVAGQHDALASRLFWYTDLETAKAAAQSQTKPILYLRLLGKLTDEYSCANSRYFRTVLYANKEVSKILRERWILVWVSERPVPVVTVDFGDGRIMKRTLTGNSIHYILDAKGSVIDALPGLYGPRAFLNNIGRPGTIARDYPGDPAVFAGYLDQTDDRLLREWQAATQTAAPVFSVAAPKFPAAGVAAQRTIGKSRIETPLIRNVAPQLVAAPDKSVVAVEPEIEQQLVVVNLVEAPKFPDAGAAAGRAIGKGFVEIPLLRKVSPQLAASLDKSIDAADAALWQKVAATKIADARLDAGSIALMKKQNPLLARDEAALAKTVERFEQLVALDTAHNEHQFRSRILKFLRETSDRSKLEDLNQRIYSELFLTPRADTWLGLNPETAYTALANNGCPTP